MQKAEILILLKQFACWLSHVLQVIMKFMEMLDNAQDYITMLVKKLAPPLVTLLSAEPEIQYVALRNINLVVQKRWATSLLW